MLPDTQENLLRDILRLGGITEHTAREANHPRKVAAHEFRSRALVASADATNQFFVRIPHGREANSENRSAARPGNILKIERLSTFMHPATTFAER